MQAINQTATKSFLNTITPNPIWEPIVPTSFQPRHHDTSVLHAAFKSFSPDFMKKSDISQIKDSVSTFTTNPDNHNALRIFSDEQNANATAPILTPRSNQFGDRTTEQTLDDRVGLENVNDEGSDEEEDDMGKQKGAKGYKAIPEEMCETIQVHNPKTNRKKRFFKCLVDNCGKTFAKSCNMQVHLRKHNGDKPYKCPHCPKRFSQSGILSRHLKNVHEKQAKKISIKVTSGDSSHECSAERFQSKSTDEGHTCKGDHSSKHCCAH